MSSSAAERRRTVRDRLTLETLGRYDIHLLSGQEIVDDLHQAAQRLRQREGSEPNPALHMYDQYELNAGPIDEGAIARGGGGSGNDPDAAPAVAAPLPSVIVSESEPEPEPEPELEPRSAQLGAPPAINAPLPLGRSSGAPQSSTGSGGPASASCR